jgi:hypothetical protein
MTGAQNVAETAPRPCRDAVATVTRPVAALARPAATAARPVATGNPTKPDALEP